jgi:hypothetical protein
LSSKNNPTSRSGAGLLRPISDAALWPPASRIAERELLPVAFTPESNRPTETDGAPLSKFGWRFREVFARAQRIPEADVDLGIVRLVEALNADTDRNLAGLAAPYVKRTEHGLIRQVRMVVNTPLLFPWLPNGRALSKMGRELAGSAKVVTRAFDHPSELSLPIMKVEGADAVLSLVAAQRSLLKLDSVASAEKLQGKRERVESIVQFGVLTPPDVVATQLVSPDGSAWVAEVAEGAQRLFSSLVGLDVIAERNTAEVATEAWFVDGARGLRDLGPKDLLRLETSLRYPASAAAGYFPGPNIPRWIEQTADKNPAAVAFQLMRTMEVNFIIAVEPDSVVTKDESHPVAATLQELIRSYHVNGKAKDQWGQTEVDSLVAIGAIDDLNEGDYISDGERSHWLGETSLPWNGEYLDSDGAPGNRLLSVARLMAALTVDGDFLGTLEPATAKGGVLKVIVNRHLTENAVRVNPEERARVAAAQAIVALEYHSTGWETTVQPALHAAFRAAWFWSPKDQKGQACWASLLSLPLGELAERAQAERIDNAATPEIAGPAQRAIAALGGIALMVNPGLLTAGTSLSRTGRGAGGQVQKVKASDPNVLLAKMVQHERGIHQLEDAVAALIAGAATSTPQDRVTGDHLEDLWLRNLWLGTAEVVMTDNPQNAFAQRIRALIDDVTLNHAEAEVLREITAGQILEREREDDDEDDALWTDSIYELIGISEEAANMVLPLLQELSEFFTTGKAYARAASRAQR